MDSEIPILTFIEINENDERLTRACDGRLETFLVGNLTVTWHETDCEKLYKWMWIEFNWKTVLQKCFLMFWQIYFKKHFFSNILYNGFYYEKEVHFSIRFSNYYGKKYTLKEYN